MTGTKIEIERGWAVDALTIAQHITSGSLPFGGGAIAGGGLRPAVEVDAARYPLAACAAEQQWGIGGHGIG
jgi:hypothetical protein